ncbi:M23 family metallopeptidase [Hydrogenivirga sp. 128-5-R1-1]|uniref:M23 family metallopeptidase n=1 Tax=Hydrogenivirga sp. 128-5-R1-1 TaxID=392423 RepID=UPI00015F35E8|nr:M23 family metallopeptidase [Hydrogenivirga sp. 128-5-R1-1]EDP76434.1 prolyl-tRNA synthetase [Hydrogenivirga sp. 128-5-R1-1]
MSLFLVLVFAISLAVGEANAAKCRLYHKVRPGDSLWKVADRYNLYIKDILRANPKLRKKKYLRVGQRICIPYKKRVVKRKKSVKKSYVVYRVRPGDSLQKIAKRFGVSWREIKRFNRLRSNVIVVGQKLKIPKKGVARKRVRRTYRRGEVVYIKYRVRRGDSLQKIAKKFGVSWKDIKRANRMRSDIIRVGQLIKVPVPKRAFERRYVDKPKINLAFLPVDGKVEKGSRGVDIYASCGDKVRAVDTGRVIYSGDDLTTYGNMVIVEHPGYLSIYAYNMQNLVDRGDKVSRGEVIGKVGLKPGSGKCALHFEIRSKDGSVLNPLEYIGKK